MKKYIIIVLALCCTAVGYAQSSITGTVSGADSEPLAGAAVVVKDTNKGVITDADGSYAIDAKAGDILIFTYVGMINSEVEVQGKSKIDVKMVTDNYSLDDVVVIGYGSLKKSDLTGSVASIKSDDLKNSKVGMVSSALQGMAAGVQVTQGNLKPGADAGIIIRGQSSINAGTAPLYVVDGMPINGGLQDLSSADIASIEVLKDASSASIYGSRGSNGVVLITTKRGASGKSKITFSVSGGVQTMLNKADMMDAAQYYDFVEGLGDPYQWTSDELRHISSGATTDWQDEITQNGTYQNYNVNLRGGGNNNRYYLGVDYYDQEGIIRNSSFDKLTVRYNMDGDINDWSRVGINFNVISSDLHNINEEVDSGYGTMFSAISSQPTAPVYASDGEYYDAFPNTRANPVAMVDLLDKVTKKLATTGNVYLEVEPIENLTIKTDNGLDFVTYKVNQYEDGRMGQHYTKDGHANVHANRRFYWQTENTANYKIQMDEHMFNAMVGFSASRTAYEDVTADSKGLNPVMKYYNLGAAEDHGPNGSYASASTLTSFFGRINYNYTDRYLFTFTMRADGSSKFAPNHRWGYFPSAAFAWRVSEESFLKNSKSLSNLKLRLSVGKLGNQNIGDYAYTALVSQGGSFNDYTFGGSLNTGAVYSSIANPNLTWEKSNQVDVGIDFGFIDNRISGSVDTYYKSTTDLLWTVPLPFESGHINSLTNIGRLDNMGAELTLNSVNINKANFQWTTSFNISYNKNELKELYDGKTDVNKSLFVGRSVGEYYTLKSQGIWQLDESSEAAKYGCLPGDRKIYDKDTNGVINGDDRDFAGQSTPRYYGGFNNTFKFYNFDLDLFMTFAGGHKINNSLLRFTESYHTWGNMGVAYSENYWRADRPTNKYPAPRAGSPYLNGDGTDVHFEDGTYLRLRNIELGYTLPRDVLKSIKLSNLRAYVSVQNAFTWTKYTGFDVEAWDNTNPYPGAISYVGGVSVSF